MVSSMAAKFFLVGLLSTVTFYAALASDPAPLQDFCVADDKSTVLVNGVVCKDPNLVQENDFFFSGLNIAGNTANPVGTNVTLINVDRLPGLNTLGISVARVDFAPWGVNAPHSHPRASEIFTVLEGTLLAGLVTSNPENRLFTKVLNKGDAFAFPQGLVHFQQNIGKGNALAIVAFGSQNPGIITIANAVFGSTPGISADILAKAFRVDQNIVKQIQSRF